MSGYVFVATNPMQPGVVRIGTSPTTPQTGADRLAFLAEVSNPQEALRLAREYFVHHNAATPAADCFSTTVEHAMAVLIAAAFGNDSRRSQMRWSQTFVEVNQVEVDSRVAALNPPSPPVMRTGFKEELQRLVPHGKKEWIGLGVVGAVALIGGAWGLLPLGLAIFLLRKPPRKIDD